MSENEVWKDVLGYEGYYKVSNKGDVYSVERLNSRGNKCGGLALKPLSDKDGYLILGLYKNGVVKKKKIHRLVSETFLPNPNNYSEVNHRDEVKTNNHVENLEWCTREYNANFGTAIKRATQVRSKKVKAVNVETGEVLRFSSTKEAERKGYDSGGVAAASRGVYKSGSTGELIGDGRTYRGHRWYYEEGE